MKRIALYFGIAAALVASCSTQEKDFLTITQDDVVFYASFEQPADEETRVYANEDLLLRWTADDRVSIFNKNTYNQEYRFIGETGDYEGGFKKEGDPEFITGEEIPHVVSVYPFQRQTRVSENEIVTVTLPAEQHYAQNSFGLGDNTMVSVSTGNLLYYRNVGGYLMLKLYGEGVSVSSVTLKGNNGEKLAGKATVMMPVDGDPSVAMASDALKEITLTCETPVQLGATAEEATQFWFVVPPVTFSKGFTITVKRASGASIEKATAKSLVIERNKLAKMTANEVEYQSVIYYTSSDGAVVIPHKSEGFGAEILSNEYIEGVGIITFNGRISSIGDSAFGGCNSLSSIIIPEGVTTIGTAAFTSCSGLTSISLPNGLVSIGDWAFNGCKSLPDISIPESVTSIGDGAFFGCSFLLSITIPKGVTSIGDWTFSNCGCFDISIPEGVTSIGEYAFLACGNLYSISIPESVISIADFAFTNCYNLQDITIPKNVISIGKSAFSSMSSVTQITVLPVMPPICGEEVFNETNNAPIYVPSQSINEYKTAEVWNSYADRIQAIPSSVPVPEAIDLGLSVKWASFNLGASKPEEYGDYFAWGETEPYYISQDPLIWKDGKEAGYDWASYKWCNGSILTLTKYCNDPYSGYNRFTDTKIVLDPEDDAALVNLGGKWRMPTDAEWTELLENCTWTWTVQNGVLVRLITASNGNCIFLPCAGLRHETNLSFVNSGYYWSSSLDTDGPWSAWYVYLSSGGDERVTTDRRYGFSVRPVFAE